VKPFEIARAVSDAAGQCVRGATPSDHALVAFRSLVGDFVLALERGGREAWAWMSIEQLRVVNQFYLALDREKP
jgi:hypothetical protein